MPSNKPRLYIALYARGATTGEPYHWALISGPKKETETTRGTRFHAKETRQPGVTTSIWEFEGRESATLATSMLLVRLCIAKIEDSERLERVLKAIPVVQNDPAWNCVTWVQNAIAALEADGRCLGTRITEWSKLELAARDYVQSKKDIDRFRTVEGAWDSKFAPTFDLLENVELIP